MDLKKKLIISAIATIFAFFGIYSYLENAKRELLLMSEVKRVLIAREDILLNTQIDETMLTEMKVPKKFLQPGALTAKEDAVGKFVSAPIKQGEQILGTKLLKIGSQKGAAFKILPGYRAVSIAVDEVTGVAYLVQPDNMVDLLVTFDFGDQAQSKKYTYLLFENIRVLAVQNNLGNQVPINLKKNEKNLFESFDLTQSITKGSLKITYTLELTPDEAQKLVLAQETGKITVALRSLLDSQNKLGLKPITPTDLTGLKSLIKQSRGPMYMEYRGGK